MFEVRKLSSLITIYKDPRNLKVTAMRKKLITLLFIIACYSGWGQVTTTIDFESGSNWVQSGSTSLSSYANHGYADGFISITGTNVLRQTSSPQDNYPGALGAYAIRLQNNSTSKIEVTITGYGIILAFGFKVRRWDGLPETDYTVEYSSDAGVNWNLAGLINNTFLSTSDWQNFSYSLSSSISATPNNFILRVKSNSTNERIMIDDLYFSSSAALPVNLSKVLVQKTGKINSIIWSTETEDNNSGFEIQRSTDAVNFEKIGFVKSLSATGNSSSRLDYTFTDYNPVGLRQYYRLKQTDFDGTSKYSAVVLVTREAPTALQLTHVYPNPSRESLYINTASPTKMELQLLVIDLGGRVVCKKQVSAEIGNNGFDIPVAHLASGTYILKVLNSSQQVVATEKFIKQ